MSVVSSYILQHVDLFDLADKYGFYSGPRLETFILCPFHSEDTPSARLYQDGLLFCFGCNKMYDPISFVMGIEDLRYKEAIKWLEKEYDFKIPPEYFEYKLDPDEKELLKRKVLELKYTLPFKQYLEVWRLYDLDDLTEKKLNRILFTSGIL